MSNTSTRLHGDTRTLVVAVTALVAALGIVSFTAGVPGLMAVGEWALLPGWMSALVPVIVDGGILVFSLVAVVRRARGEGAVFAWSCLAILTLGSVAAQVAHVLLGSNSVAATAIAGAVVAGAFPSVVFASTHAILDLAIAPAPKRGKHVEQGPTEAPEQSAEPRAFILRETPITRPSNDTERPARRVGRDAEKVVPGRAEQPAEVLVPATAVDAEQVTEQIEQDVPEVGVQTARAVSAAPARPVSAAPARPAPSSPARKAVSTVTATGSGTTAYADLDEDGQAARRAEAVAAVQAGASVAGTAKRLAVPRSSLQRWVAAEAESIAA
ncbi:hypothetical protein C5B85_10840 [Pseudoclavibacter sp. AY1F1]|uniref:helix-turn-helix domain-containing protein n=1 Tax=Pseudoclavibacter sp. AY1F1 TaxID=2080583 RepID=UPI000CE766B1|nr:helix-turn-helix domain-containing protein [Pseudoclavibacter sp. AY1F1]PPF44134.1 hypothetical protein C5B85_10840 [Pseudoclavibacter sp. AY1F1]